MSTAPDARAWQGLLEVVIAESGEVLSARLLEPFHPAYDEQLLKAARAWKYRPAQKNGMPVRFLKLIGIRFGGAD
jgi:TonB family protein